MSDAIYRKYRPSTFADVTGQDHVKNTLQNQLATGKIAHAYLFTGPRGVGKTTLARLLAKAVNCTGKKEGESEPCNKCSQCVAMNEGRLLDVIEIDAASNTGVDNVRENIIEAVRFTPSQARYKVFIIDEVHMLSGSAFNALLKTLEEPPRHVLFILATTESHKLPATIVSRCQRFDFHRVDTKRIVDRLNSIAKAEGVEVAPEVFLDIARLSEGCLRDAESMLGQVFSLGEKTISSELASLVLPTTNREVVEGIIKSIVAREPKSALEALNTFVDQGGSVKHLIDEILETVRRQMIEGLAGGSPYGPSHVSAPSQAACIIDSLLKARGRVSPEAFPQMALEVAIIELSAAPTPKPSEPPKVPSPAVKDEQSGAPAAVVSLPPITDAKVQDVIDKWGRVLEAIARRNIALPLVLKEAKPMAIEGSALKLGIAHMFHFETANQPKHIAMIEAAVSEVMMGAMQVHPIKIAMPVEETVETLIQEFGGEIADIE